MKETGSDAATMNLKARLEAYERKLIESALQAAGGHQRRAAAALGVLPTTLNEKLKRLGMRASREQPLDASREQAPAPELAGSAERSRS